jgi:hypothetical protein
MKTYTVLVLLLTLASAVSSVDVFQVFEQEMLSARSKQAVLELSDVLLEKVEDKPKEIEIVCPGEVSPIVSIRDLVKDSANAFEGGECMRLKMKGHNFNFQLSVNCEEKERVDMMFNNDDDNNKKRKPKGEINSDGEIDDIEDDGLYY